jgi:protochlorophyllide reductase
MRLLITGANSGIGLEAARLLTRAGHHLVVFCRSPERCEQTQVCLVTAGAELEQIRCLVVDLADLSTVEAACKQLLEEGQPFDALVLNAGQQRAGAAAPVFSAQGVEITFAVNHLAHQCMAMRLAPLLRKASQPRVVITASDVHNPASGGGRVGAPAGLGDLAGLRAGTGFVMVDGSDRFDGDKAYKDSKLANVLMARALARQLEQVPAPAIAVIAWSPGLVIPRSAGGFFRYNRARNPLGIALFALVARDLLRVSESIEVAGRLLADLALDRSFAVPGFHYFSNRLVRPGCHRFEAAETSSEAADLQKAEALWRFSEQIIASTMT